MKKNIIIVKRRKKSSSSKPKKSKIRKKDFKTPKKIIKYKKIIGILLKKLVKK